MLAMLAQLLRAPVAAESPFGSLVQEQMCKFSLVMPLIFRAFASHAPAL
jgi:hypothetical protein